jgi:hypothetical protein
MKIKSDDQIFGYIVPSTFEVNSKVVPYQYAKTYGDKNGITHLDVFGYITASGSEYTWIWKNGETSWYGEPDEELKMRVDDHLSNQYDIAKSLHATETSRANAYKNKESIIMHDANSNFPIVMAQIVKEKDYPPVEDIAVYVESLKLYLKDGVVKDKELVRLIENLPSPINISKRLSNEEVKVIFQTVGYLWSKITGHSIIEDSKIESKKETLCGNYWIIKKGIILEGVNHYSIIKQNLELFRSLLNINAFALHEKLSSRPDELIKLAIDHGGVRLFISKDKRFYAQCTDTTYGEWAKNKIRKYDFNKKIVKVIDSSRPYKGWKSGLVVVLR